MKKLSLFLFLVLLFLISFSFSCSKGGREVEVSSPTETQAVIYGRVVNATDESPIASVRVTCDCEALNFHGEEYSSNGDKDEDCGWFEFKIEMGKVSQAQAVVRVSEEEFLSCEEKEVEIEPGKRDHIRIYCQLK